VKYFRLISAGGVSLVMEVIKTKEWDDFIQLKPELLNKLFTDWVEKFFQNI
jgi:hypothetical protein